HHHDGADEDDAVEDVPVLREHGFVHQAPHAGDGEDDFHDERAGDESGDGAADHGDDGEGGVGEDPAPEVGVAVEAAGAGCDGVAFAEFFEHGGAHLAEQKGQGGQYEDEHRQDQVGVYPREVFPKTEVGAVVGDAGG